MAKGGDTLTLVLKKTPDILGDLGQRRVAKGGGPLLVGFAAETEDVVWRATAKREAKHVDLIVANDVSRADAGLRRRHQRRHDRRARGRRGAAAAEQGARRGRDSRPRRERLLATVRLEPDVTYDWTMDRDQLIEHLTFAKELGVSGVSRDPAWRERSNPPKGRRHGHV